MAGVAEKPYAPILNASIPAFYEENGTAVITVPFSMNRAVSAGSVYSFSLKIKTAQSNIYITTLESDNDSALADIGNRVVKFYWRNFNAEAGISRVRIGQYLKVQLAYNMRDEEENTIVGYFSTVAITKFTSKPHVYIKGMDSLDSDRIPVFKYSYVGTYEVTEDVNERPYAYNFFLYDYKKDLIEESGWQLHNSSINTLVQEATQTSETTDTYSFTTGVLNGKEYYVQYAVRTINNLEIYSPMYTCIESSESIFDLQANLIAENIFEEGYIVLSLSKQAENNKTVISSPISIEISRAEVGYSNYINNIDNLTWRSLKKFFFDVGTPYDIIEGIRFKDYTVEQGVRYIYCYKQYNENGVSTDRQVSEPIIADFEDMFLYDGKLQLKIRFNPKVSSFKITRQEQKIDTIGSKFPFVFRNGIVEYKEFPISGLISYLADNNQEFFKDEEDLNIIRANEVYREAGTPIYENVYTIAHVKNTDILEEEDPSEEIIEAIQEEVDFSNNCYAPNTYYLKYGNTYFLASGQYGDYPNGTTFYEKSVINHEPQVPWETTETLNSIGYNMRAERRFKLKLLEWLGDGNIKLFRSPAEGNYLVRLMNISLTPEDKLGRMIHSFSATAYEVEELSYKNLYELGFINIDEYEELKTGAESINIKDKIEEMATEGVSTTKRLNDKDIINILSIAPSENTNSTSFYVRVGGSDISKKALIRTGAFTIAAPDQLPNIWINLEDNKVLSSDLYEAFELKTLLNGENKVITDATLFDSFSEGIREQFLVPGGQSVKSGTRVKHVIIAAAKDLVGDAVLTYVYKITEVEVGETGNIANVYIKNVIASKIGPATGNNSIKCHYQTEQAGTGIILHHDVMQWYVLNFIQKTQMQIYEVKNGNQSTYYTDSAHTPANLIKSFDKNVLYKVDDNAQIYYSTNTTTLNRSFDSNTGSQSYKDAHAIRLSIINTNDTEDEVSFNSVPNVDLRGNNFYEISFGACYQLDYAYQEKVTEESVSQEVG